MNTALPRRGAVERYAQLRAVLDKTAFITALGGPAVLIRLDERGGHDEPAPWAFHGSGLPLPVDIPASDEDIFIDRTRETSRARSPDASTMTGPALSLSVPAARGRATLHVVPARSHASVGRERSCDVAVEERSVSRRHASLEAREETIQLRCLQATNGVAVNGRQLSPNEAVPLSSGDILELGDVSLLFLEAGALWDGLPRLMDG